MIRVEIRGENIEVTDAIREHIEDKIAKLERYFNDVPNTHAHVNIKVDFRSASLVELNRYCRAVVEFLSPWLFLF